MEKNDFKESQRRVALMKFIGECYNYKVIDTHTLLDILYKHINYDIEKRTEDEYMKSLDNPADSFRIRLVCTVLDSLGKYFWRGERKKQMDRFLFFFERYIFSKNYVLMDLEFMILDTFDNIRPKFVRFATGEEAEEACKLIDEAEQHGEDIQKVIRSYLEEDDYYSQQYDDDYYYDEYADEGGKDQDKKSNNEGDDEDETPELEDEADKDLIKQQRQQIMSE